MLNLGFGFQTLIGMILVFAGAGLYFMRTWRPKLARDHDIFFAAIGLLSGGILIFQGWRLDPILAFGQLLLTGSTIFFAVEAISLREITTKQAKERTSPMVDEERPTSPFYSYAETEFDELEQSGEYPPKRRIRGTRDDSYSRADSYEDDYRRRPSRKSNYDQQGEAKGKLRKRSGRPGDYSRSSEDWETSVEQENRRPSFRSRENFSDANRQEDKPRRYSSRYSSEAATDEERVSHNRSIEPTSIASYSQERPPRARKTRPPEASSAGREVKSADYVEYTPMDYNNNDVDGSTNS